MKILRQYQSEGEKDIFDAWDAGHRIIMYVCATGGGKTVTFVDVIRWFLIRKMRTMLVAHREELITQAFNTLFGENIYSGIIQGSKKTDYDLPSQVCSIQTIARRSNLPDADLIVIDEGHHCTDDNSYAKLLQRYPNARVLIVTATPYRLSGEGFEHIIKHERTHLILNRTTKQLIDEAWLVPIRYFLASMPDLSNVGTAKGDYIEEEAHNAMKLAPIVDSYLEHANGMSGVCFAVNVAHSKDIAANYIKAGIAAIHLDANTPDEDYVDKDGQAQYGRRSIVQRFRDGLIKIVVNVDIFTEGTDFPNCRFVQLARPTKALSKYFQMVGRGLRAEAGLVDQFDSVEMRAFAISCSSKPNCIVLDNAGLWLEHGLPDQEVKWEEHFIGRKKLKKKKTEEELEMMVWVAEDGDGNRIRTFNAHEIIGLRLIEVTTAVRDKLINLTSIKEFDKVYAQMQRVPQCKKPGYVAVQQYIKFCNKSNTLMTPEVWKYLFDKCVLEPKEAENKVMFDHEQMLHPLPADMLTQTVARIRARSVSSRWLMELREEYTRKNAAQMAEYQYSLATK